MKRILATISAMLLSALCACAPLHQDNARSYLGQGRLDEAAIEIQAALASDPSNLQLKHLAAEIFNKRGVKFYQDSQMLAAEDDFRRAVDYEPTYAPAYDYLGLIAFSRHDWQNAISYGEKSASLSGQPDPTYVRQAEEALRKVRAGGIRPYVKSKRRRHSYGDDNF